ncbi:uncharacterized protein LOC110876613 [Helianthus annuus]|uniref:uncharacterized protein LOC110876613 n=1 Tax=Helianthus annuus TaxID=4232 RepID=UPI000B8F66B1|nr:uncharacterized protein LOC110876613 [Helianthus annuus]
MTTTNGGIQTQIPKLSGQNYFHWHIQMKVLLESQDLWTIIEEGYREPAAGALESDRNNHKEIVKKDKKALNIMFQAVNDTIFERIATSRTSKEAWDTLHKAYRGEHRVKTVKLQTLRCEFDALRMKDSETIEEYVNRTTVIVNQLRLNEENITEQRIIEKLLRSLTRKYEAVVIAIEESKDQSALSTLSTEELLGILQSHELRLKQYDDIPKWNKPFKYKAQVRIGQDPLDQKITIEEEVGEEVEIMDKYDAITVKNWGTRLVFVRKRMRMIRITVF